ncbi:MAG: AAA family ATPase [Rudaea sp.]
MSQVIVVANVKGGVGKTTTTVNLAAAFAERGGKVLAIDLDPQGSLTLSFGFQPDEQTRTIVDMLDAKDVPPGLMLETAEGVQVIPANQDLRSFERDLDANPARIFALKHALKPLRARYEFILLDCPANAGPLTGAALAAADKVVVPLTPDYLSFQVSRSLFRIIKEIQKRINPNLQVAGIYLTMYDGRTRHAREILQGLHDTYGSDMPLFSAVVRQSVRLKEAPMAGKSILKYEPQSQASVAYRVIAQEIDEGIGSKLPPRGKGKRPLKMAETGPDAKPAQATYNSIIVAPTFESVPVAGPRKDIPDWREVEPDLEEQAGGSRVPAAPSPRMAPPPPPAARATALPLPPTPAPAAAKAAPAVSRPPAPPVPAAQAQTSQKPSAAAGSSPNLPASRDDLHKEAGKLIEQATNAIQRGDMHQGHSLFRQAIVLNPQDVRAWIGCARTSDNLPERISFAKQALKLDPANPDARDLILLTSTFMRMSVKDRWAGAPSRLASASVGLLMIMIVVSLLVASQFVH